MTVESTAGVAPPCIGKPSLNASGPRGRRSVTTSTGTSTVSTSADAPAAAARRTIVALCARSGNR